MVQIDIINENDITTLKIDGDVDASSSIQLDESMSASMEGVNRKILVDCSSLNYISSAGLGVFMSYLEDIDSKNIRLALFGLSEKVHNVFEILGLDQLLTIVKSKEEALAIINEA